MLALAMYSFAANDKIAWKPITDAILRVDEQAPKLWNLFGAGKKTDPLLLQLGTRSLVIYVQQQKVYEIAPAKLQRKGTDLLWHEEDKPGQPLATSEWNVRDVGATVRIRMKLSAEGRTFDIQLPEPLDNRLLH
jgi:hypothetical protein